MPERWDWAARRFAGHDATHRKCLSLRQGLFLCADDAAALLRALEPILCTGRHRGILAYYRKFPAFAGEHIYNIYDAGILALAAELGIQLSQAETDDAILARLTEADYYGREVRDSRIDSLCTFRVRLRRKKKPGILPLLDVRGWRCIAGGSCRSDESSSHGDERQRQNECRFAHGAFPFVILPSIARTAYESFDIEHNDTEGYE